MKEKLIISGTHTPQGGGSFKYKKIKKMLEPGA
jgi:hypothetical protein